ncbi:hypothetical protein PRIPAC_73196, partial [Pristionchus pacificus]|uniref:Immunoglobulin n=1 Tax=Pristionchus pacificus TaxID=54126 RepID=A0A2A6C193_PRIPA
MPFMRPRGERAENQILPNFIRPLNDKRAVVGEAVVLECQLEGHPDPVVKWLKDGHDISLCPDYKIEQDGHRHRLIISMVQGADSGRFTAHALNPAGSQQSTCILIVAPAPTPIPGAKSVADSPAPPQTPVGPSAPIFLKELRHQPLLPGARLVLEGRVVAVPNPTVEWLKNGKPLQNYRAQIDHDPVSGICHLTIPQMFPDDVGEYTCRATNVHGEAVTSANWLEYACRATNVHGEAVTSANLLPREQYERWFSDEQQRLTRDRRAAMGGGQQQQQRPPSRGQQQWQQPAGVLRSGNGGGNLSDVDSSWGISESETEPELVALDPRGGGFKPIIRQPLRGLSLTEGTDAILQASIVGTPKPQVAWLKNGRPLQLSGPRMQMSYKGAMALLKINLVNVDDGGEYTVIAENKHGK